MSGRPGSAERTLTTSTLHRSKRLGEDGLALTLEVLDQVEGLVGGLVFVDGADVGPGRLGKSLGQSLDLVEVCLSAVSFLSQSLCRSTRMTH